MRALPSLARIAEAAVRSPRFGRDAGHPSFLRETRFRSEARKRVSTHGSRGASLVSLGCRGRVRLSTEAGGRFRCWIKSPAKRLAFVVPGGSGQVQTVPARTGTSDSGSCGRRWMGQQRTQVLLLDRVVRTIEALPSPLICSGASPLSLVGWIVVGMELFLRRSSADQPPPGASRA